MSDIINARHPSSAARNAAEKPMPAPAAAVTKTDFPRNRLCPSTYLGAVVILISDVVLINLAPSIRLTLSNYHRQSGLTR